MKITETNLNDSLKKSLDNVYIILAEEAILIEENLKKIYQKAKKENFNEKDTYVVDSKTNWDFLFSNTENLDLFGSKKIIEIKLLGQGPGIKGSNALQKYVKSPNLDTLLIVIGENLERKSISSAWVKALEKNGSLLSITPLSSNSLEIWINSKGKELNVEITKEARKLLAEKTEGNLMATLQEIRKLSLSYPSEEIDLSKMKKTITDSSKFSIFDFSNAFILRNTKKAIHILESLKAEGTPETLIVWALSRELNNLFKVYKTGSSKGIWGPRKYLDSLEETSKQVNEQQILKALKSIAFIDSCIKGFNKQNPWLGIRELTLTF
tara:strand:- start:204 stop:1175 length:972 start_codon:yes stop_codon:yes gene_type:complete